MDTNQTIVLPHVNLNGTGPKTLVEDYRNAYYKVMEAIEYLRRVEFHSRDYAQQANGQAIWRQAVAEQEARFAKLQSVADELLTVAMHVDQFIKD